MYMSRSRFLALMLLCCGFTSLRAHAGATLLLEEPYSVDGAFAGTGHTAVYLDRVCADTPLLLRRCTPGEMGVRKVSRAACSTCSLLVDSLQCAPAAR